MNQNQHLDQHMGSKTARRITASLMAVVVVTGLTGMSSLKSLKGDPKSDVTPDYATVLDGSHRSDDHRARDAFRHPAQTLAFMGLETDMQVAEIWPGGSGWYLRVIAPTLKQGGGAYTAVTPWDPASENERVQGAIKKFDETYVADTQTYGTIHRTLMRGASTDIAPEGSLDMVLTFRNVHNWMTGDPKTDNTQNYMNAFFKALKSGGTLGVVEHRANDAAAQDPAAGNGYVHVAQVKALAEAAGFEFVAASQVNANPKDTADHPFGVWTLPPTKSSAKRGEDMAADFDRAHFDAIGESDRMTLKFRKP